MLRQRSMHHVSTGKSSEFHLVDFYVLWNYHVKNAYLLSKGIKSYKARITRRTAKNDTSKNKFLQRTIQHVTKTFIQWLH